MIILPSLTTRLVHQSLWKVGRMYFLNLGQAEFSRNIVYRSASVTPLSCRIEFITNARKCVLMCQIYHEKCPKFQDFRGTCGNDASKWCVIVIRSGCELSFHSSWLTDDMALNPNDKPHGNLRTLLLALVVFLFLVDEIRCEVYRSLQWSAGNIM